MTIENKLNFFSSISQGESCRSTCGQTLNCTHYNWTPDQEGICWLRKDGIQREEAILVNDEQFKCGILPLAIGSLTEKGLIWFITGNAAWAFGCELKGNDFKSKDVLHPEKCLSVCSGTKTCTHFDYKNGTCFLKRGGAGKGNAIPIPEKNAICGVF